LGRVCYDGNVVFKKWLWLSTLDIGHSTFDIHLKPIYRTGDLQSD
jgi:hypothetical protein